MALEALKFETEKEVSIEEIKSIREEKYGEDVKNSPDKKMSSDIHNSLKTHNNIASTYGKELTTEVKKNQIINHEDEVAIEIATELHDSGKIKSNSDRGHVNDHHLEGVERAREILNEMLGQEISGVEITNDFIKKVTDSIYRHMNHPYLVMLKGEKYPEPQNIVDKIVFDADMLANVGYKNVIFRLKIPDNLEKDSHAAQKNNITSLQASFENVVETGKILAGNKKEKVVYTKEAQTRIEELIELVDKIMEALINKNIFEEAENKYYKDNKFDIPELIIYLNQEIKAAAQELSIPKNIFERFII
ncbi:MAG: HD domain-containing protein [Patescibacteria group bacterium]